MPTGVHELLLSAGEVYLTPDDANRVAGYLGLSTDEFRSRCCEIEDGDLRLAGPTDGPCRFVEDGGCSIHDVKPLQCRAFPFWPENVRGRRAWEIYAAIAPVSE